MIQYKRKCLVRKDGFVVVADIYLIRLECESDSDWFTREIRSKLDGGSSGLFWKKWWIDDQPSYQKFPNLFWLALNENESIAQKVSWTESRKLVLKLVIGSELECEARSC